jgi:hypothetical protein
LGANSSVVVPADVPHDFVAIVAHYVGGTTLSSPLDGSENSDGLARSMPQLRAIQPRF